MHLLLQPLELGCSYFLLIRRSYNNALRIHDERGNLFFALICTTSDSHRYSGSKHESNRPPSKGIYFLLNFQKNVFTSQIIGVSVA